MVLVARDIVEKEFLSLSRETTELEADRQMKAKRHGFAIITSATGGPEGIVTEWDYLSKIVAEGKDPSHVKLGYHDERSGLRGFQRGAGSGCGTNGTQRDSES